MFKESKLEVMVSVTTVMSKQVTQSLKRKTKIMTMSHIILKIFLSAWTANQFLTGSTNSMVSTSITIAKYVVTTHTKDRKLSRDISVNGVMLMACAAWEFQTR